MNEYEKSLYEKAIKLWGMDAQIDMMIEECAELIHALQKFKRNGSTTLCEIKVEEEIADVEIMINQMKLIFSEHQIDGIKSSKLSRLENMIRKGMQ